MAFSAWPTQERTQTAPNSSLQPPPQRKGLLPTSYSSMLTRISHLDGKHVVFGEVLEGYEIVEKIENVPKQPGDKPTIPVKITKSGELPVPEEGIHVDL